MKNRKSAIDKLVGSLEERAKELDCLYAIEEVLNDPDQSLNSVCERMIEEIPSGWQHADICQVKIILGETTYSTPNFVDTPWVQTADILVQESVVGTVSVSYREEMPDADDGPFLKEEVKLIKSIARRFGHFVMYRAMREAVQQVDSTRKEGVLKAAGQWRIVLELLKETDRYLYLSISRKMLNQLCWNGIKEAEQLYISFGMDQKALEKDLLIDWNRPHSRPPVDLSPEFSTAAFSIAEKYLSDEEILRLIRWWMQEDKLSFIVQVVNRNLSLSEVADAIRRYHHLAPDESRVPSASERGIQVSLIRRFLSDQLQYINVAKNFIEIRDFYNLLKKVIFSAESHGKLGGKSAGLYLAAQVLRKRGKESELLANVKIPRTWHVTSDVLLHFMHYNDFDHVVEQKYKPLNQVALEYPHVVYTFKSSPFPADIVKGLSVALDDLGDKPLIVRSSSLLEDRLGSAFSGKYKSLFLANQGSKQMRLQALMDAIAEVYASTFSPDPVEYRAERGLLDYGEEMGIIIQEVVGNRVGKYFTPTFAGVAFSSNEFRWSSRIKREDGLVRLVPGLGTRAVDRLSDDYPVLVAPGQPGLRVNTEPQAALRYSPRFLDVINLKENKLETIELDGFLREVGYELPAVKRMVSVYRDQHLQKPIGMSIDFESDVLVANFEGLISDTKFVERVRAILQALEAAQGVPVDIEFAHDGTSFYLLQCRPQSYYYESAPAHIPDNLRAEDIIFSARKYISNGRVPDITHIVYVDPHKYAEVADQSTLVAIGRAVGALNQTLPRRQFILMGPGRWGSRGDIKLGVSVTYADISNTAVLIEVARKKGNYVPDLSFGTHFFQDLVEAEIRYLPLYPDDDGIVFNEPFLLNSLNIFARLVPEYAELADTIRVIDVPGSANGRILKILMNADIDKAVGVLQKPS